MIIEFTPRDFLMAFFRQRLKFIAVFFTIITVGIIYLLVVQPSYRSTGSLLIKFGKDATPDLSSPPNTWSADISRDVRNEIIESNIKILQSRSLLEIALKEIGIENVYPNLMKIENMQSRLDYAIQSLAGDLIVRAGQKDSIIQVSLGNQDPRVAALFTRRLMELFIVRQSEVYNKPQTEFLSEQVKQAKNNLDLSKQKFVDFKKQNGISNIETELEELLRQKSDSSKAAFEAVMDAQKTLSELEAQHAKMAATYRGSSPVMARLRESIAESQKQLENRQKELDSSQSPDSGLSQQIGTINRRISYLENLQGTYNELAQQVEVDSESYKNYLLHSEETRVTQSLNKENITRISIVDEPTVPSRPERPRKKVVIFISLMAALLAGASIAITFEVLDDRFSNGKQLSRTLNSNLLATFNTNITSPELVKLYGTIENSTKSIRCPILHFTSAYSGEGSSEISFNLARLVADQVGKRVLFIDTIANNQHLHQASSIVPLPQAFFNQPDAIIADNITAPITDKLFYSMLQKDSTTRVIFSNNDEVRNLFDLIRQKFDLVIINTESFLAQTSAMVFVSQVDAHVLVVEANRTRSPVITEVKTLIGANGGSVLGSVLNRRELYIPNWLYTKLYA